jgi:hypothetical protein
VIEGPAGAGVIKSFLADQTDRELFHAKSAGAPRLRGLPGRRLPGNAGYPQRYCSEPLQSQPDGPVEIVNIKCPVGHHFHAPIEFLSPEGNTGTSTKPAA